MYSSYFISNTKLSSMEKLPSYKKMLEFMPLFGVPFDFYSNPKDQNLIDLELKMKGRVGMILYRISPSMFDKNSFIITFTSVFDPTDLSYYLYKMIIIGKKAAAHLHEDPTQVRLHKIFYDLQSIINYQILHVDIRKVNVKSVTNVP